MTYATPINRMKVRWKNGAQNVFGRGQSSSIESNLRRNVDNFVAIIFLRGAFLIALLY